MRKKRPPANYVLTLEKRNDMLTKFFSQLEKFHTLEERDTFFKSQKQTISQCLDDIEEKTPTTQEQSKELYLDDSELHKLSLGAPMLKIRLVYGPTSVYANDVDIRAKLLQKREAREVSVLKTLNKDPDILSCVRLFFTWQYPDHNMFVFREAFLNDFFHPKANSLYCLSVLVFSICALGARMCDVDTIYLHSITYYNEARSSLLSSLEHPTITSVQSFLLLAFYDICNGNNSTAWMLSGNAIRMGFDLGFQLNPEVWFLKSHGAVKPLDVAIRSRIYWGCYMADHFISLVLGRPSLLKMLDASIPETLDLPELDWIDEYKFIPKNVTNISDPLKNIINLINISDNMLNDVFTKSDHNASTKTSHGEDLNLTARLSKLSEYNAQIMQWKKNLPADLNWNRESLSSAADNPTIASVRHYYYILILCLNRPFVGITNASKSQDRLSPAVICNSAIEDLYVAIRRFELTHGLRRASIFIVYCSILSISVILLTTSSDLLEEDKRTQLKFFMNVLLGCSKTWALAEKSYKLIESKLQLQFVDDPDFAVSGNKRMRTKRNKHTANEVDTKQNESLSGSPPAVSLPPVSGSSSVNSTYLTEVDKVPLENEMLQSNYDDMMDHQVEFFGGPPVLMTSDLFNEDWEALFPDSIFSLRTRHLGEEGN